MSNVYAFLEASILIVVSWMCIEKKVLAVSKAAFKCQ